MRTEPQALTVKQAPPGSLGSRIAEARRASGLTQEQLGQGMGADGSDLGKGAVSSWEVDRTQPSAMQIARLADRLHVSTEYLLRGREWDSTERRGKPAQPATDKKAA